MCGIAGVIRRGDWTEPPEAVARRMAEALGHRGPDDFGTWAQGDLAFGHTRLAVLDLSAAGHQPMLSPEGDCVLVYNGEIYNFEQLRRELAAEGVAFRSRTDTEVLLHLYRRDGVRCVERLRGMFAFAVWDARRRRLVLARDRLGVKPLVYHQGPGGFAFASELAALLQSPTVPREPDYTALGQYLTFQYVPSPATAFRQVRKLPPGHTLVWEGERLTVERYWRPAFLPKHREPEEGLIEELRRRLAEAVRVRLVADVPLGAFLSGGIDSTIVTGLMSREAGGRVRTFSIGFQEAGYDERGFARIAARRFATAHTEAVVKPDAAAILPDLVRHYGEPFADSSAIPTWYLARMTREHVTVALSGDGGDESFAGYERYKAYRIAQVYRRLPRVLRRGLLRRLARALPHSDRRGLYRKGKRFFSQIGESPEADYLRLICFFDPERKAQLLTEAFHRGITESAEAFLDRVYAGTEAEAAELDRLIGVDLGTYLPDDINVKVDIAAMAHSLEVRSPFLDQELVEFAARLPARLKLRGLAQKYLLKRAFPDLLPSSIRDRGKMGFGVPLDYWFRGELAELLKDTLLSERFRQRGLFRPAAVERLIAEHERRRADHQYRLWALLFLEQWFRAFIDAPSR